MIKENPNAFSHRLLITFLAGLLLYQSWMLWQLLQPPANTAQLNEQNFNLYPDIVFDLSTSNPAQSWSQLKEEDYRVIENWLSADLMIAKIKKNQNEYSLSFDAPPSSKPSSILQKLKFYPQIEIISIEIKTNNSRRLFLITFIEK
jgi:hypothetical protein